MAGQRKRDKDFTLEEAAEYLGVAQSTLREWDNKGVFDRTWRTPGGHRRFDRQELREIRMRRQHPDADAARSDWATLLELVLRTIEQTGVSELDAPQVLALADELDEAAERARQMAGRLRQEAGLNGRESSTSRPARR